jgi:methylmalonyl-CoA mutase
VLDPAGGSWYVESLTEELAQAAWAWFTEIERAGGLQAALASGLVADRIAAAWAQRSSRIAHRRDAITGVSEFPNLAEQLPVRDPAPEVLPTGGLPRVRAAAAFEELRDAAEATDPRPAVYLATIGPVARHTARATFAANLFQAGGLRTPSGDGTAGLAEAGTTVACLCGTDQDYASAGELAEELRAAGATSVWLAGRPSLEVDGVDGYVYAGCDALAVLRTLHEELLPEKAPAAGREAAREEAR